MRLTCLITVLQFLVQTVGFPQVSYPNVQFSPFKPGVGQNVKVSYVPPRAKVLIGRVICLVYFTGPPTEMNGKGFPIVREANMTQRDSIWECEIQGDPNAFGIAVVFADSLGSVDNYDGGGYRNLFFKNGQIIPGASAGLAELYRTGGTTRYIRHNKQLARVLYETDFMKYPQVKRTFIAGYLETFDLLIPADTLPFRRQLEIYAHYPDKTESDLRSLWRFYHRFNKPEQATAYRDQCFRQFPNGHWAVTHASLLLGIQLPGAKDDSSKVEIYNQYKKRFDHHYENESMRNQMSDRKGDFLSYLIEIYVKGDSLDAWEKETNSMDDYGKCHVYLRTATQLLHEARQKKGLINNPALPMQKELDHEHPFLIFPVANDDFRPPLAEQLSRHAVELYRANLNAPRRIQESLWFTDEQVAKGRNVMLAMYLDRLGQSLLKQNKFEDAYGVIQEAINRTVYQDQQINEHFIEILVKTNRLQEAIEESRKMMGVGKSTSLIDACYQQLTDENFTIARERTAMLETAKLKLNEQLLNLKAPDFEFVNLEGKSISLKTLRNKTIVLDF